MGQAKRRGSLEERIAQAQAKEQERIQARVRFEASSPKPTHKSGLLALVALTSTFTRSR